MANVKFTEFPSAATVGGTDIIPIVQGGINKKATGAVFSTYIGSAFVALTGNQTIAGVKTFSSQLVSTIATGTAPFSVASTTKVTNLNADLLDGLSSAAFQTVLTNPITGTGTTNYLPKFTGASALGNSLIYDNGTSIGIGTSSPAANLDVNGVGAGAYTVLNLQNSQARAAGVGVRINLQPNSDFSGLDVGAGISAVNTSGTIQNNTDLIFESGLLGTGYERMRITSGGNVGIGTTAPLSILETKEANRTNGSNITNVGIYSTSAQDTGVGGTIGFGGLFTGSDYAPFGSIRGGKENNTSGNYAGYLAFQTIQNGGSLVERGRFASGGNFLIGTSTDAGYKLDVNGTGRFSGASGVPALDIRSSNTNFALMSILGNQTGDVNWLIMSGYPNAGDFTIRQSDTVDALNIKKTTGNATFAGSVSINNAVNPAVAVASTHKVTMVIGGVTYYLLASNV